MPKKLRFFSGGNSEINERRIHARNKLKSELNKSNKFFLDYLTSDYAREILAKSKIKILFDTVNISGAKRSWKRAFMIFYSRSRTKQKKLLDYEISFTGDLDSYINEIIDPITEDRNDLHTNSGSKFLFYHFNNLMCYLDEETYKIRYTLISDQKYAPEVLQSKNWSCLIEKMLEVSLGWYFIIES